MDGLEIPGSEIEGGYKYFGAAKNLPKVRELFEREAPAPPKVNRTELYKRVTYQYLGYGAQTHELEKAEREAEQKIRAKQLEEVAKKRMKIEESQKMLSNTNNA
jgi:pre-mRNA-splicing factor ISY1